MLSSVTPFDDAPPLAIARLAPCAVVDELALERALGTMARTLNPGDTLLTEWAEHPDERLATALIAPSDDGAHRPTWHRSLSARLYARARRDAHREGTAWTPVLDALAAAQMWPDAASLRAATLDPADPITGWRTLEAQLAPIAAWLVTDAPPEQVAGLLHARAPQIQALVATHTLLWSDALLAAVLAKPGLAPLLATNPHLTSAHQDIVASWVLTELAAGDPLRFEAAELTLRALGSRGYRLTASILTGMMALVTDAPSTRRPSAGVALQLLLDAPGALDAADLHRLYAHTNAIASPRLALYRLLRHPAVDAALCAQVLADWPEDEEVTVRVAQAIAVRADPVLRARLARSGQPPVLRVLLGAAAGPEFRELFQRLAACDAAQALAALEEHAAAAQAALRPEDLLECFAKANDAASRIDALDALRLITPGPEFRRPT